MDYMFDLGYAVGRARLAKENLELINKIHFKSPKERE